MDEPLSNLDAKLRLRLRAELKALQRQLGITTVYVTHDQEEALSLSDQVVVLDKGRVQQADAPEDIYQRPANRFVAEFVGQANLLPVSALEPRDGTAAAVALGRPLLLRLPDGRRPPVGAAGLAVVRPEHVQLVGAAPAAPSGGGSLDGAWHAEARVASRGFFGAFARYWLELPDLPDAWLVDVPMSALGPAHGLDVGARVGVAIAPGAACWLW